ncbi:nuclear transport factor 2 family protein [Flavivirga spongiicola]|uniref:Nuclear transport factor 2 family protein n=1 Tax=Flavivirga spongiicola TaxID=421621 RepID=A0ABU7XLG2_9FLAO|nr:nuclear transport factor 2 family protein [Flavivirga sp. MEBiC05379]MDO5981263.1 nuclear transport factor 2 family protein [Flavivirga sp. MEBiC05379]
MKTTIITLLLCISVSINAFAQETDYNLVEKTVSYYLDGGTNNDFETLKKAFHKDATMKFISKGVYKEVNALAFFKRVIKPGPKQNRKTQISYINVSGNTANAKLEIEYPTFTFIDYMNLLKIDGEWKIVSKIYYKKPKTSNSQTDIEKEKHIKQIIENTKNFSEYVNTSNYKMIGESYTDDAKIFPQRGEILEGKEAILKYWTLPKGIKTINHKITQHKIRIVENTAYDYGLYQGTTVKENGEQSNWSGKYVIVWKKEGENWKMYLDIWNNIN